MKVAIIGSGISGLGAAHALLGHADVTLFEAGSYFGGHAHTVDVTLPGPNGPVTHGVDTGFLVYNERTYPNLINLFEQLGVKTAKSDMSFSVQTADGLEWAGSSISSVFAQRKNLTSLKFLGMLADIVRFNSLTTAIAKRGAERDLAQPLDDFLVKHRFGDAFRNWYFMPMMGCIWSCPTEQMLQFPVATMIRFCHNHGLLQITNRPQWFTVDGGSRNYVARITDQIADKRLNTPVQMVERDEFGVRVISASRAERFDKVIFATHPDQALALLRKPSAPEVEILSAIRYQDNLAVLHTDEAMLPKSRIAWASWNYERSPTADAEASGVCLHYLLNMLQPLPFEQSVVVSLNPVREIARTKIMGQFNYSHPVFDAAAMRAQQRSDEIQGEQHSYFCGAWTGYGFHEDGLKSGLSVARQLLSTFADRKVEARLAA